MAVIVCRYRSLEMGQPLCEIVSQITDRPLSECHVNDAACAYCLSCKIPPQAPNKVTASMAIEVARRTCDLTFMKDIQRRVGYVLQAPHPVTTCVLRGSEVRQVACKPCQAGGRRKVMVSVFSCPVHEECTLHNTGTHPKLQACATCADRRESSVMTGIDHETTPAVQKQP